MKIKKRFFTLLEVLISLGLTLLILSSLLGAYFSVEKSTMWWQNEENEQFAERFFSHRLLEIFNHLSDIDQNKTFFFTSQGNAGFFLPGTASLIFSYDNGASLDTDLSGSVLGRLFVDPQGNLTLLTWPDREIWQDQSHPPFHREVLMKNVTGLKFSFLTTYRGEEQAQATGWHDEYSKEQKELPGAIKMMLTTQNKRDPIFYFPIPQILSVIFERP